jgi:hypothetical protein
MRALGATEEEIAQRRTEWLAAQEDAAAGSFEIFPANCEAFEVFMMCRTQWEMPSMASSRCTIAFAEIECAMRMLRVRDTIDCLRRVKVLLNTARNVFITKHNVEQRGG